MAPIPQAVVAAPIENEDDCPVCLEPLSFSFRIPGEKPHIVPECGHALHEACFSAVYGPLSSRTGAGRKTNLGVCGVCRRPMKVGDGDSSKNNKLAALTGMGGKRLQNTTQLYPGLENAGVARPGEMAYMSPRPGARTPVIIDSQSPTDDDALEPIRSPPASTHSSLSGQQSVYVTTPGIQVRPEFPTIPRNGQPTQAMTCIVIVELPNRKPPDMRSPIGRGRMDSSWGADQRIMRGREFEDREPVTASSPSYHSGPLRPWEREERQTGGSIDVGPVSPISPKEVLEPTPQSPNIPLPPVIETPNPAFQRIADDLKARIADWKGHELAQMGALQMFDILKVRRDSQIREFYVYLFREAVICVIEEKKKGLNRILGATSSSGGVEGGGKGSLRLKGRIYIKHIRTVTESDEKDPEQSLTVHMEDESFILIYPDRTSMQNWARHVMALVEDSRRRDGLPPSSEKNSDPECESGPPVAMFNSGKAAKLLGGGPVPSGRDGRDGASLAPSGSGGTTMSDSAASATEDSLLQSSQRSTMSSVVTGASPAQYVRGPNGQMRLQKAPSASSLQHSPSYNSLGSPMSPGGAQNVPTGQPSNLLPPLPHPGLDLVVIVSVPTPHAWQLATGSASLKLNVLRSTLDFILGNMGPRDRLSFVTFEVGLQGRIRRTPFLSPGKSTSKRRLEAFIAGMAKDGNDEFLVPPTKEEKTDVVTAVNNALDVVLQRKNRNYVSGVILVSDSADTMRRAQMDLVLARTEAANVPIHSFGWGRSHDPACLWLMSNHTQGTYTYVKDWYDLRECLAGLLGGYFSMGLLNMKLHLKVVDGTRFRIRKVSGGPGAIVSSSGRDVDIDIGELRYGERKEMLVELELDNQSDPAATRRGLSALSEADELRSRGPLNATDQFVAQMGLDALSLNEPTNLVDGVMDRMIDEAPVFEVDGSFFDPVSAKNVSRLVHPVLLTVTLMPYSGRPQTPHGQSDPHIVRRRMELLASEMMTRALVLVSRKSFEQAGRILAETQRILRTVLHTVTQSLPPPTSGGMGRSRRELLILGTVRSLQSVLQDIQVLTDALEDTRDEFAFDQRNFGAQQAMILRDQKSWTSRTATEKLFFNSELSPELVQRSADWIVRE
ncbi:hypothetical protein DACRYDRAFT_21059 [Dacryopinax primogenitus]|uniref:RING-type domain-containing protein n=1 Tax=Dacryopinax primogenitus (strain DJM 731) TaxID=1858805 RepID=M5FZM2_DACPD|nr:uncharacterized protein DACRYDRAFT_21059 [Dacryopinax primogenitus]EJU03476.1 hypothetical protein DACRYDRAFT_21059 [Dacryopinax primogenitus]